MEHKCNAWCRGDVHALLFTQTGNDYQAATNAAEALLSTVGMVSATEYSMAQAASVIPGETFTRFYALGRYAAKREKND